MTLDFEDLWSHRGNFGLLLDANRVILAATASASTVFGVPVSEIIGTHFDDWVVYAPTATVKSRTGKTTHVSMTWKNNADGTMTGWCDPADSEYSAKVQAERYADDLKQLEYAVSHDLMEPIRMVNGYLSMYIDEAKMGKVNDDYLVKAQGAVTLTRKFLMDFVGYLRLDSQHRNSATLRPVNLNEIVQDVLRSLHLLVQEAGAVVTVGDLPTLPGDGRMFYQVFSNLIANALKYRDPSRVCNIVISASEAPDVYVITVIDNGRGIHPSKINHVFAPFVRGYKDIPGTGIGLAIVKRCLEYHNGSIRAASVLGNGATFTIKLPKGRGQLETPVSPG